VVGLLARVQVLDVTVNTPARIVIDERTGTIVVGAGVRIAEVAIAQGGLTVEITRTPLVSQPNAFSSGATRVVTESKLTATEQTGVVHHVPESASLADVVQALNALGAQPRSLIAIFESLRAAGALQAEIEVQ
jgi:flagellar P-ring protein precursor FlgI